MRAKTFTTRSDGMVYVRVSLREGSIPLEQMLGAEEPLQSWHAMHPEPPITDDTTEVASQKQRKNSKLRCLVRHNRQKKCTNPTS